MALRTSRHGLLVPGPQPARTGTPPGRPGYLVPLWGSTDWRRAPPQSPLLTVASIHRTRMTSLKMRTPPPGECGPSRQPHGLSGGLGVRLLCRRVQTATWASLSPPSLAPLPPVFHLSTSTLHLALVLAFQSPPTRGAPLTEAPDDPRHCFLGQRTRGQGSRGLVRPIPARPPLPCKVVQDVHCTRALPAGTTVHIADLTSLYSYDDTFLAGGGKVS